MIPAKYFFDENGNVAKIISVSEIEPYHEAEDEELYRVTLLYPDGTTSERDMGYNVNGGYELFRHGEKKLIPVKIVNETIYFAYDTEHIPQEDVISIDVEHISKLIESITILGSAMENTIASVHSLFNPQK